MADGKLDEVGLWTEIKLRILRDYSSAYSTILGKQSIIKHYAYIDGFAGPGRHISKASGQEIDGSPAIALSQKFTHYHFIDLDGHRAKRLRELAKGRNDVTVYEGDCNEVLLNEVLPRCRFDDFRRALCLLDPYGLNPNWKVVESIGKMKSVEIFLNFMIMDANMNVLWTNPNRVSASQKERMNIFWGDDSWEKAAYRNSPGLFGDMQEKTNNEAVIAAYRQRLKEVAGFKYVPEPLAMRNRTGAVVYYLFFASHNETGEKIARDIFNKFRSGATGDGD
ncbi:MAG: three-Cys-motif partner protein TcmP [Sedimentisphaerales bacterium]|nr:three-Cys-motif partner protein TcmP [Sedimentisphaerales bacterium]